MDHKWNELFFLDYDAGVLIFKDRPMSSLNSERERKRWNTRYAGKPAGTKSHNHYWQIRIGNRFYLAHRIIWEMVNGQIPDGLNVDHRDGNTLNNTPHNLRLSTQSQNRMNSKTRCDSKSGIKGVMWRKGRWEASIGMGGVCKIIGRYTSISDAKEAREKAAKEHHGEFARS